MKKLVALLLVCVMGVAAQAVLVDDFEDGNMDEYVTTVVLETTGGAYDTTFSASGGALSASLGAYPGIEQALCLRDDYSLSVGDILKIDTTGYAGGNQDMGIAVAAIKTPTAGVRQDYVFIFMRNGRTQLGTRSFDGTSETTLVQSWPGAVDALYIERTGANNWETGYYIGSEKTMIHSMTVANGDIGNAIGFYSDMRAVNTIGTVDNLEIVPEPATMGLLGLGALIFARKRK